MGKSIGIIAIKGGVGKTSISSSLAVDLAKNQGGKVLVIDGNYSAPNLGIHMDVLSPEKTIHHVLGERVPIRKAIYENHGVDIIPGSVSYTRYFNPLKLKDKIHNLKKDYDYVIIDGSPSLNDELLSTILASDLLFVVSTPDYPTLSCSIRAAKLAKLRGKPIAGILLNKVRDPNFELSIKEIESATDIPVVARILDEKIHTRALFNRVPVSLAYKNSNFAREINNLGRVIAEKKRRKSVFDFIFGKKLEEVNREVLRENLYTNVFSS
ncbi:hypothetical protein COU54_05175 [Candidatus Pacearchaeota archaeon CG10_big_fil_rev_8_21_14_0_10_31_24]|nr:MAG: hypothetical protein COU54_05175 [Candidatus Pacearchaeota archaeon CG10_big_fil_rev_8_21_14_0_10_31_24]